MTPLFTVHAGEYIVGEKIEKEFKGLNVWIPSKDTGIDLLITNKNNTKTVSLQVKLSRDYSPLKAVTDFDRSLIVGGWCNLAHNKIAKSTAGYWVFVLVSHERREQPQFIVIPPKELLKRLIANNHEKESAKYDFYPWVIKSKDSKVVTLDGRGLNREDKAALAEGSFKLGNRDLSIFLDDWSALQKLQK